MALTNLNHDSTPVKNELRPLFSRSRPLTSFVWFGLEITPAPNDDKTPNKRFLTPLFVFICSRSLRSI